MSVSNFNNNHVTTTITVADLCYVVPKTIRFIEVDLFPLVFEDCILINPNPTDGLVTINVILQDANPDDAINITVTDNMGTTWFNQTYSDGTLPEQFNFSSLPIGNYIITATQSGYIVSKQLSKH